jgi:hypothetical protein
LEFLDEELIVERPNQLLAITIHRGITVMHHHDDHVDRGGDDRGALRDRVVVVRVLSGFDTLASYCTNASWICSLLVAPSSPSPASSSRKAV